MLVPKPRKFVVDQKHYANITLTISIFIVMINVRQSHFVISDFTPSIAQEAVKLPM